jgi:hypothetical protein
MKRFLTVLIVAITFIANDALVAQNNSLQQYQIAPTNKFSNTQTRNSPTALLARHTSRSLKSRNTSGANTAQISQQFQQAAISSNKKAPNSRNRVPLQISTKQLNALEALNKQSSNDKGAFVYFDSKSGTPTFIKLDSNPPNISARGSRDEISTASAIPTLINEFIIYCFFLKSDLIVLTIKSIVEFDLIFDCPTRNSKIITRPRAIQPYSCIKSCPGIGASCAKQTTGKINNSKYFIITS